jgi:hypothetical protein
VIKVHSQPTLEPNPEGGWQLVFLVGDAFDYSTPFREMLTEIAVVLGRETPGSLELPAYEVGEDFVEGTIKFGDDTILAYFEHSLGYLALVSDREDTLQNAAKRLQPHLTVV